MYLVNGQASALIGAADRGFQYGDGLFETIAINDRHAVFLDRHLRRLQAGCQKLLIPIPDIGQLLAEIGTVCQAAPASGQAVLKLVITRGVGGRGYRQPETIAPTRVISLHPFPDYPDAYQKQGVVTRFCHTRLGISPALAGLKHLNRLEQVLARAEWSSPDIQEGIMLDCNDKVIEGTMSNLFYGQNNALHTARLTRSGVAGILRQLVIEICQRQNLTLIEHDYRAADLLAAEEIFLTNAIIGVWPVKQIDGRHFPIGALTRTIQTGLAQLRATDIGFEA